MSDLFEKCFDWKDADEARATGFYPFFQAISETFGTEVMLKGKRTIMIGSNNYLGLSTDPRVKEAAIKAVEKFGSSCSGSRFLNGTLDLHEELEAKLAAFFRKESAIVFSTGFQTNQGTIAPLLGRDDMVFIDRGDHASILDGVDLSAAERKRFRHNDAADLERLLSAAARDKADAGKLIVVDGVFSMEGDIAPLPKIVELKKKYGARLMVDDAHGAGILGKNGRGTGEHFGVEDDVDLVMTTFSKSFASLGGVIAGPRKVLDWVKHKSRALIFSASMTPASVAAALKALEIIQSEPQRRERLWEITRKMRTAYQTMGFDTGTSETPIIPLVIGDDMRTFMFWKALLDAGVFVNPVRMPAVPPGQQLIRTSYMATHTDAQLDRVLDIVEQVGKQVGIIGPNAVPREKTGS
ncbi:MAG TPA: aminotransferase class I/II-fold pyridoxal phosphate-dependent enzyme [bacterium]|nr:aminotransferase class I/II-fold pyridoxal phosphate-dependent enzyme [bacterium]